VGLQVGAVTGPKDNKVAGPRHAKRGPGGMAEGIAFLKRAPSATVAVSDQVHGGRAPDRAGVGSDGIPATGSPCPRGHDRVVTSCPVPRCCRIRERWGRRSRWWTGALGFPKWTATWKAAGPGAAGTRATFRHPAAPGGHGNAVAAFGHDAGLRPNLLIGGVAGLAERDWEGSGCGSEPCSSGLVDLRERCVMTTFDPDTQERMGCCRRSVASSAACPQRPRSEGGTLHRGDAVELLPG
jgi:hypothetical protein